MTKPAEYPDAFFICHRRYTGPNMPAGGDWGNVNGTCDGPQRDDEAVIEAMIENWRLTEETHEPDATDFKVWFTTPDKPREDCTAWALRTMIETMQERAKERGLL